MIAHDVVLPDTLVAELINGAATLSAYIHRDFEQLAAQRDILREKMLAEQRIRPLTTKYPPLEYTCAIDGAHLAEIDRASAYSASCAVAVGAANRENWQSSCLATLPHVPSLNAISSGLMLMQEIMMTVRVREELFDTVCLIDGSRISAIIGVNSFYTGMERDMPGQLDQWRHQAHMQPDREPGHTLALFESRDWLTPYLTDTWIVYCLDRNETKRPSNYVRVRPAR